MKKIALLVTLLSLSACGEDYGKTNKIHGANADEIVNKYIVYVEDRRTGICYASLWPNTNSARLTSVDCDKARKEIKK